MQKNSIYLNLIRLPPSGLKILSTYEVCSSVCRWNLIIGKKLVQRMLLEIKYAMYNFFIIIKFSVPSMSGQLILKSKVKIFMTQRFLGTIKMRSSEPEKAYDYFSRGEIWSLVQKWQEIFFNKTQFYIFVWKIVMKKKGRWCQKVSKNIFLTQKKN